MATLIVLSALQGCRDAARRVLVVLGQRGSPAEQNVSVSLRKELDDRMRLMIKTSGKQREIDASDVVTRYFTFPARFNDVRAILELAGFRVGKTKRLPINGGSYISASLPPYSPYFGFSYQTMIVIDTRTLGEFDDVIGMSCAIGRSDL